MLVLRCSVLTCLAFLFAWSGRCYPDTLACRGDFDNGRIFVDSIHQEQRILWTSIPADNHTQTSTMRYWHSLITGIRPGEKLTINHRGTTGSIKYVYSYDGENWFRFPETGILDKQHRFVASSVEISPNIAYPYGRSLSLCAELASIPCVTASNLAVSEEGREVKLLRITDPLVPDSGKRLIWVQGRQHAFESASSYVVEGLARWLASDDSAALEFRCRVVAYLVPIMDVDNVYKGMTGKEQPNDFNRVWNLPISPWRAVAATKANLSTLCDGKNNLLAFIDCHQPTYTDKSSWYVVATNGNWSKFSELFRQGATEAGKINTNSMRAGIRDTTGGDTTDSRARTYVSGKWGTAPDYIGTTMESAHYLDDANNLMVKEGYIQWGEALGRALYKYQGGLMTTANIPPKAVVTLVKIDSMGVCEMDGGQSTDPDGTVQEYQWCFGDGRMDTTRVPIITHSYGQLGYYPVQLRVLDNKGKSSPAAAITVKIDSLGISTALDKFPDRPAGVENIRFSAYPNPFNPAVRIALTGFQNLPPGKIRISVFNAAGKKIKQLVDVKPELLPSENRRTLQVTWDGSDGTGKLVASGIYLIQAEIDRRNLVERVFYLR